ncbi:MAG: pyruvate, phosphate dikinase, partial [Pseudomonadota bacterium]
MQKHIDIPDFVEITPSAPISAGLHGGRAKCLQRLIRLDMPLPRTVALSFPAVRELASGQLPDLKELLETFGPKPLISVRPSSQDPDWGGPGAILNIGMNDARHAELIQTMGHDAADALYRRFIQSYAAHVARLDPDVFDEDESDSDLAGLLAAYEDEADEPFPQDIERQLADVLQSMARAWEGTTARLLRQARGAPPDAGLGLVVQDMALGVGRAESGSGVIQFVDATTGAPQITGRYLSQSQGRDAVRQVEGAIYLTRDPRGPSLEELCPEIFEALKGYGALCRSRLKEEMEIEFTIHAGALSILDAVRVPRGARAEVQIAVALAEDGIIP